MDADIQAQFERLRERVAAEPDLAGFDVVSLARPSVRLGTVRVPYAQLGPGASRIGGVPDVPTGFEWPRWLPPPRRDNVFTLPRPGTPAPLGFIAQIDLSDIPHVDDAMPRSGWLLFFYDRYWEPWGFDPADRGGCRVIYLDGDRAELTRTEPPEDADPQHTAHACLAEAWPELTLPDEFSGFESGTPGGDAYDTLRDQGAGSCDVAHRLLGHPQMIQNPMELECQLASNGVYCGGASHFQEAEAKALEPGAVDWRLLLQIDTDEDGPGWMWGDVGRIYFWIKHQDLAALRFDDAWVVLQCC